MLHMRRSTSEGPLQTVHIGGSTRDGYMGRSTWDSPHGTVHMGRWPGPQGIPTNSKTVPQPGFTLIYPLPLSLSLSFYLSLSLVLNLWRAVSFSCFFLSFLQLKAKVKVAIIQYFLIKTITALCKTGVWVHVCVHKHVRVAVRASGGMGACVQ